jgi:hypothetical protein
VGPLGQDPKLKFCTERGRLADELLHASMAYASAVGDLADKLGTAPEIEYKQVKFTVEELRLEAERCRDALRDDRINHGC